MHSFLKASALNNRERMISVNIVLEWFYHFVVNGCCCCCCFCCLGGTDFFPASGSLVFSDIRTRLSFRVSIQNDVDTEGVEVFTARLTTTEDRVVLAPDLTAIDILDDEGAKNTSVYTEGASIGVELLFFFVNVVITIGFLNRSYTAIEGDRVAVLEVGIILGNLQRDFVISFSTENLNVANAANSTYDRSTHTHTHTHTHTYTCMCI